MRTLNITEFSKVTGGYINGQNDPLLLAFEGGDTGFGKPSLINVVTLPGGTFPNPGKKPDFVCIPEPAPNGVG